MKDKDYEIVPHDAACPRCQQKISLWKGEKVPVRDIADFWAHSRILSLFAICPGCSSEITIKAGPFDGAPSEKTRHLSWMRNLHRLNSMAESIDENRFLDDNFPPSRQKLRFRLRRIARHIRRSKKSVQCLARDVAYLASRKKRKRKSGD
jgi:hypothetical protein